MQSSWLVEGFYPPPAPALPPFLYIAYPHSPFLQLFLWSSVFDWMCDHAKSTVLFYLINDTMDLNLASLGTLVTAAPWCVFYATWHQTYRSLNTNDRVFATKTYFRSHSFSTYAKKFSKNLPPLFFFFLILQFLRYYCLKNGLTKRS